MSELTHQPEEVVDGVPVPARATNGSVAPRSRPPVPVRLAAVPVRQAAALAATGFVAGAAAVAVAGRRPRRTLSRRARRRKGTLGEIVASNSFLVDVHLIRRS